MPLHFRGRYREGENKKSKKSAGLEMSEEASTRPESKKKANFSLASSPGRQSSQKRYVPAGLRPRTPWPGH